MKIKNMNMNYAQYKIKNLLWQNTWKLEKNKTMVFKIS